VIINYTGAYSKLPIASVFGEQTMLWVGKTTDGDNTMYTLWMAYGNFHERIYQNNDSLKVMRVYTDIIQAYADGQKIYNVLNGIDDLEEAQ
jgi:hypothetical protein